MNKIDCIVSMNDVFYHSFHSTSIWSKARDSVFLNSDVMYTIPIELFIYHELKHANKHNLTNS